MILFFWSVRSWHFTIGHVWFKFFLIWTLEFKKKGVFGFWRKIPKTIFALFFWAVFWKRTKKLLTLSRRKKKVALILTKISPRNNRFSWVSKPLKFLWYLFSFMSYREKIGLHIFFNSAHFKFFYFFYSYSAKSAHSLELECVWIFLIASTIQKIFKK